LRQRFRKEVDCAMKTSGQPGRARPSLPSFSFHLPLLFPPSDLLELPADLQVEVRSLVFELHGKTFQTVHRRPRQRPNDIEWLTLLHGEFQKLTRALEIISRSPLQRVEITHVLDRSLRPARPGSEVRNFLRRNSGRCIQAEKGHFKAGGRSWLSPQLPRMSKALMPNTAENRFVACTISRIRSRLRRLQSQLAGVQSRDRFAQWTTFLSDADRELHRFQAQTFLSDLPAQQSQPCTLRGPGLEHKSMSLSRST